MKTLIILAAATFVALATPAFAEHGGHGMGNHGGNNGYRSHGGEMRGGRDFGGHGHVYNSCVRRTPLGWVTVC